MEQEKRSREISEYLSKLPGKGTAPWPTSGINKSLEKKSYFRNQSSPTSSLPGKNHVEILFFGSCVSNING
jgi:hypothetical protein